MTFNNYACYYRKYFYNFSVNELRIGKLRIALQYLEKALIIEKSMPSNIASRADTHLNMCAVLSELGRHDVAYEHAKNAIIIVQGNLLMNYLPKRYIN